MLYINYATRIAAEELMAFHNPDPRVRALEQRNARERAELFAKLFRSVWRRLAKVATRLARVRYR